MSIIVANPLPSLPLPFTPMIVETSKTFPTGGGGGGGQGGWKYDPDLLANQIEVHAGSVNVSTCELLYRYGSIKQPWESAFAAKQARDMIGNWVRVSMVAGPSKTTVFLGKIEGHSTDLYGTAVDSSGVQRLSAVGGLRNLEKMQIATAYCRDQFDPSPQLIGWLPPMNKRDRRGFLVGNKSAPYDNAYFYGGTNAWTHLDYLNYLVANFIQVKDTTGAIVGPTWTVTGQSDILAKMQTTIDFGKTASAAAMLQKLIPVKYGIDFNVLPTDNGFEINVFALVAQSTAIAGVTMPSNPKAVSFEKDTDIELTECQLVTTTERRVDEVLVRGKRIVVCGSLFGKRSAAALKKSMTTLLPKWSAALETDYKSAGGLVSSSPSAGSVAFDRARKREIYREVYQHFGAPAAWDFQNLPGDTKDSVDADGQPTNSTNGSWCLACNLDGSLKNTTFQKFMRETLSWIPLRRGFDYTRFPPTDNTLGDDTTEPTRPLMAWIYDENPEDGSAPHYVQCELEGIHTSKPYEDWGIMLNASPNHLLCRNHWTDDALLGATDLDNETELRYDYETAVATIAMESDWPVSMGYQMPAKLAAGDGSTLVVDDDESELWVLLPKTIVECKNDYQAVAASSGSSAVAPPDMSQLLDSGDMIRVLRDDRPRLALLLAGAVGRYINERARAHIACKGFRAYFDLIGTILTAVQQGDALRTVGAPITSIIWSLSPKPMTIVKTGYA